MAIELFAGSPDDNNAHFFFDGAMSVLKPYIDSGKLKVLSGQTSFEQGATLQNRHGAVKKEMRVVVVGRSCEQFDVERPFFVF